ncbi:unnamed protein product [Lepidochelys kempii]
MKVLRCCSDGHQHRFNRDTEGPHGASNAQLHVGSHAELHHPGEALRNLLLLRSNIPLESLGVQREHAHGGTPSETWSSGSQCSETDWERIAIFLVFQHSEQVRGPNTNSPRLVLASSEDERFSATEWKSV